MFCSRCGSNNADGQRFCINCGTTLRGTGGVKPPAPSQPVSAPPQPAMTDLRSLPGQVIEGKYRIEKLLGEGGMGAVFRATRLNINDSVAVKVLHPGQLSTSQGAERFRREAQAAARLKHPNAVVIHDFGVSNGLLYLVMELVEGRSIREMIEQQGALPPDAVAEIMSQTCSALDDAHTLGIVHRDIKPDNIMVSTVGGRYRVKVLDFGIAKLKDISADTGRGTLTQAGTVIGTPQYMSPEQCLGEELDGRSDIYSLGVVMYEMLSGKLPFNAPTLQSLIAQQITHRPPSLRSLNPAISPAVESVVMQALEKERNDRPQKASVLSQALIAALNQTVPQQPRQTVRQEGAETAPVQPSFAPLSAAGTRPAIPLSTHPQPMPPQPAPPYPTHPSAPLVNEPARRRSFLPLLAILGVLLVLGAGGAYYFLRTSAKEAILAEIKHGNLVKPEGLSAYDLYLKHAKSDLSRQEALEISAQVIPQLEQRGEAIFNALMQEATEVEDDWQESTRIYSWLHEMKPAPRYESRKFFSQGRRDLLRKNFNDALAGFKRSSELEPKWALPLNGLGRAWIGLKDKVKAKDCYKRAAAADPKWISPLINLATLALENEEYQDTQQYARKALEVDPNKASAHYLLARSLEKTDQMCDAAREFQLALDNAGNAANPGFNVDNTRKKLEQINAMCSGATVPETTNDPVKQ